MTLRELQEQIEETMGKKVPTAAYLRGCQCPIAASRVMEDGGRLSVYANGFALYETGDGSTVFRADHCGGYIYFGRTGETSFTEEMNLMCIFDHSSKAALVNDMEASLPYIDDADMLALMEQALSSLRDMTEEEYAGLVFEPALDEGESWGGDG